MAKILMVDDSAICRDSVRALLELEGFTVITLESPLGFSRALIREQPDLVLLDASMPALSGDQVLKIALRGRPAPCPVLIYSGGTEEELGVMVRGSGATGFIKKGLPADAFVRAIRRHIRTG